MANKPCVLVVDDEPSIQSSIRRSLEDEFEVLTASDAFEAKAHFSHPAREGQPIACILSDQRMPGETGAMLLAWVRENSPDTSRLLITGYSDFDSVVSAINQGGVFQFLHKPWEPAELENGVRRATEHHRLILENRALKESLQARNAVLESENQSLRKQALTEPEALRHLIGHSVALQKLKAKVTALLPSQSTVLITGESGTGKELVARALHFGGARRSKPFVAQNCAALPESILESELFGHLKGAFTHATENRMGIIEAAQGGTLFLDEVGDMSLAMQARLLRFLQEGVITPVGGRTERKVEVRVIAATHRNLEVMVADQTFREDLFYRLNVIPLHTPPLRERPDDIPLLAEHFSQQLAKKMGLKPKRIAPSMLVALQKQLFPGNVRELQNALEHALNMAGNAEELLEAHLPERYLTQKSQPGITGENAPPKGTQFEGPNSPELPHDLPLDDAIMALEKAWIERALQECEGNISGAARKLGLSRQGLHNKLAKYNIRA